MTADLITALRRTSLLAAVPDAYLAVLAGASRTRVLRRGQVVCGAGDPGDTLIVVLSGRLKVVTRSAEGSELTLTILDPGATLGEVSIADGGPRSADVETMADTRLLLIPRERVLDACARTPGAALALAASVAATVRRLTGEAADLAFLDLPRRIAKVLLGQPRDAGGVIAPPLTQEQLARLAAGTRQSVNAVLRGFEQRGWIAVDGRDVAVRQPEAMARFVG
jgi:CRP/FNR family transcriptional regulator, cyclic AMP receptor protein